MEEQQFQRLSLDNKAKILWENGKFVESINSYYNYRINLYALHNKFVEVYYHKGEEAIVKITMASERDLKKYLLRIILDIYN